MRATLAALVGVCLLSACGAGHHGASGSGGGETAASRQRILGGTTASHGRFPWLAFVLDARSGTRGLCTGTVVAPSLVLTAGHCVVNRATGAVEPISGFRVATGEMGAQPSRAAVSQVSEVLVYPGYPETSHTDAALLVLSTPTTAPPVKLATQSPSSSRTHATIVGWRLGERRLLPTGVLMASTTIQPQKACEQYRGLDPRSEICAETAPGAPETGACPGESGGPIVTESPGHGGTVEVGVVRAILSKGSRCADLTLATRVPAISSWVRRWVTTATATGPPSPAVTRAIAYAAALNLTPSDLPRAREVELGGVTVPSPAEHTFLTCLGDAGAPARVAAINSSRLAIIGGSDLEQFSSAVVTMPTAALAARRLRVASSRRGERCVEELYAREGTPKASDGHSFRSGHPAVSRLPAPTGVVGYRVTIELEEYQSRSKGRHYLRSFDTYIDQFAFLDGAHTVSLDALSVHHPPSSATEKQLLGLLQARARSHTRSA
jgi:trypsin